VRDLTVNSVDDFDKSWDTFVEIATTLLEFKPQKSRAQAAKPWQA
jgi:hypothetical protein